jgi:hypothetical protein
MVIINHIRKKILLIEMKLASIFRQIHFELEALHSFVPLHILHHNNTIADAQANQALRDPIETLRVNDHSLETPIP